MTKILFAKLPIHVLQTLLKFRPFFRLTTGGAEGLFDSKTMFGSGQRVPGRRFWDPWTLAGAPTINMAVATINMAVPTINIV